ncbi:MAG TPA: hypothetical protein VIO16_08590 [Dehalococcoidia bacterium]
MPKQFIFAQPVAFIARGDQGAEQIVTQFPPSLFDDGAKIVGELGHAAVRAFDLVGAEDWFEAFGQIIGPAFEQVAVLSRNAEHLGDHDYGQRIRQVGDDVHAAALLHGVEEVFHYLFYARPHRLYRARRERLADETPQTGMVGWVDGQ